VVTLRLRTVASHDGARTLVVTAQPDGAVPGRADVVVHLPAQTMADDRGGEPSLLPMGSLYEAAQLVFFDLVSIMLREQSGQAAALYDEVVERLGHLAGHAAEVGLVALLVEPTPLPREIPSTVAEARQLVADTSGGAVPVLFVLDVGHALYRPLYGEDASLVPWLSELSDSIGVLHLQNHDYRADAHWGWPDARGAYDPAGCFREVRDAGLEGVPAFIEVFSPFEQADDEILPLIRSSLAACRG